MPGLERAHAIAAHHWQSSAWQDDDDVACWGVRPRGEIQMGARPQNVVALPSR